LTFENLWSALFWSAMMNFQKRFWTSRYSLKLL